ncbi:MAG: CDP-alcohol phosphatidyltransferase family protein [Proteobacteria bacterium]|nr:CDP-alcohol phosphatidyltransferase family protein [Pseudomonadota bacterium]
MVGWGDKDAFVLRVHPFLRARWIDPTFLTLAGVALSLASGTAFYLDRPVWAGAILIGAGWCDMVDGVVARHQGRASLRGAFLDSTLDRLSDLLLFGGIALGATRRAETGLALLALWAATVAVLTSYSRARAELHLSRLDVGWMDRGWRCLILIAGGLTGRVEIALLAIGLGGTWTAGRRVWTGWRQLESLERTGRDPTLGPDPRSPREGPEKADSEPGAPRNR